MPWYFSCKSHWFCGLVQIHPQDVVVFILNTATESGWLSPWDPPLQWGKVRKRIYRPATHPIYFAADSPRQNHRCAAWAVFFTNRTLCGCTNLRILFTVVACTTSKCYSCVWKKQNVVSALRPAFFIQYLESCISRPNEIPCHDLTLSVNEPDNAAAQTGAGTSFGANGDPHTWAAQPLLIFCALTIRKQLPRNGFERSGRGQEPSRGHKFSILENVVLHRDFTSQTLASFPSDLVGACLPQTLLMVRT